MEPEPFENVDFRCVLRLQQSLSRVETARSASDDRDPQGVIAVPRLFTGNAITVRCF